VSFSLLWQYAVIALLVVVSVLYTFRKVAPKLAARWQAAASIALTRPGRSRAAQALGRWLSPRGATGNCGGGCGACGSCETPRRAADHPDGQPIAFRSR